MDNISECKQGGKLLEFGCGPCVHNALVASRVFTNITMAENAQTHRQAVSQWLKNENNPFDWSDFLEVIADWEKEE